MTWFSLGILVSSTNKAEHHNITEILLKEALNTINHPQFLQVAVYTVQDLGNVLYSIILSLFMQFPDLNDDGIADLVITEPSRIKDRSEMQQNSM